MLSTAPFRSSTRSSRRSTVHRNGTVDRRSNGWGFIWPQGGDFRLAAVSAYGQGQGLSVASSSSKANQRGFTAINEKAAGGADRAELRRARGVHALPRRTAARRALSTRSSRSPGRRATTRHDVEARAVCAVMLEPLGDAVHCSYGRSQCVRPRSRPGSSATRCRGRPFGALLGGRGVQAQTIHTRTAERQGMKDEMQQLVARIRK
jgi:hypothetical protein